MWFLLKMSGHSTSYDKWFRIYGDSKNTLNFINYSWKWCHHFRLYEKMWMSHELWYIRNISMAKLEKNLLRWKLARWSMFSGCYPPHYYWISPTWNSRNVLLGITYSEQQKYSTPHNLLRIAEGYTPYNLVHITRLYSV